LCIAADDDGNVLTSTTPPFSASAWSLSAVDPFRIVTGLACSLNVFCVIGDDAGNVLAGTGTASNPGPPVGSAPPPAGAVVPTPSCTIRAKSANVLVPPAKKATHKRRARGPKPGTVSFVIRCNQTVDVTLQGRLTELVRATHGRRHSKIFVLPRAHGSARAGVDVTLTVNLPTNAVTALRAHTHESVKVTLTARDLNGTTVTSATIRSLRPVAIHASAL
jgi:hypothetical protein